jgi:hypothetical protein
MKERRSEARLWCSDLIKVRLDGRGRREITANLEDISPSGACIQLEEPLPTDASVRLTCRRVRLQGTVKYCIHNEIGYFAGVCFKTGQKWSRQLFEPEHLLDPASVRAVRR